MCIEIFFSYLFKTKSEHLFTPRNKEKSNKTLSKHILWQLLLVAAVQTQTYTALRQMLYSSGFTPLKPRERFNCMYCLTYCILDSSIMAQLYWWRGKRRERDRQTDRQMWKWLSWIGPNFRPTYCNLPLNEDFMLCSTDVKLNFNVDNIFSGSWLDHMVLNTSCCENTEERCRRC